jgi:hypothetical protein
MKAFAKSIIIMAVAVFFGGNCDTNAVTPCTIGIPILTHGGCHLIIQVLNNQIGRTYSYRPPGGPVPDGFPIIEYENTVTTPTQLNINFGDTIYFHYKMSNYFKDCGLIPGMLRPPEVPNIEILSYSKTTCP